MIGNGTKFYYETTVGSGTYTELDACIDNISWNGLTITELDESCLADDQWMSFEPGMGDPGSITLDINFGDSSAFNTLWGLLFSKRRWRIEWPVPAGMSTGATLTSSGFISTVGIETPTRDKITDQFVWKLSGEPVFVPVA